MAQPFISCLITDVLVNITVLLLACHIKQSFRMHNEASFYLFTDTDAPRLEPLSPYDSVCVI